MRLTIDTNPDEDQALAALAKRELGLGDAADDPRSDEERVADMILRLVHTRLVRRRLSDQRAQTMADTHVADSSGGPE